LGRQARSGFRRGGAPARTLSAASRHMR
jgi:hypothetical protein